MKTKLLALAILAALAGCSTIPPATLANNEAAENKTMFANTRAEGLQEQFLADCRARGLRIVELSDIRVICAQDLTTPEQMKWAYKTTRMNNGDSSLPPRIIYRYGTMQLGDNVRVTGDKFVQIYNTSGYFLGTQIDTPEVRAAFRAQFASLAVEPL